VERELRSDVEDPSAGEVDELRRAAAARRDAQLALSPSQRLALVDALCRQAADLPRPTSTAR